MNSIQRSEAGRRVPPVEPGRQRRLREDEERDFATELQRRLEDEAPAPQEDSSQDEGALPEDRVEIRGQGAAEEVPPAKDEENLAEPRPGRHLDLRA